MAGLQLRVVLLFASSLLIVSGKSDSHSECAKWAQEGECRKNARFMLEDCATSCVSEMAKDDHERCLEWANEGECTKNPGFMQLSCSGSCGVSRIWSPITRSALNLHHHESVHIHEDNIKANNIALDSALKMGNRLRMLFIDNIDSFSLSTDVWMLSASLGEAMLYTVNSAIVATKGFTESKYGKIILNSAILLSKEISNNMGHSPDMFHRNALKLWNKINDEILHVFIAAMSVLGPDECSANSLYTKEHKQNTINDGLVIYLPPVKEHVNPSSVMATLRNREKMPAIGFGTCWLSPQETYSAVLEAFKNGVRHIDTAEAYRNEEAIGRAIADSNVVDRSHVFLATKISQGESHGYEQTQQLVKRQLQDLQTDYIDLYYIHGYPQPPHDQRFEGTWRALEEFVEAGVIRHLGVSNYNAAQIRSMFQGPEAKNFKIKPSVIQNKFEPFHQGDQLNREGADLVTFAKSFQMSMVGYSTLRGWPLSISALEDPHVEAIAERLGRSPGQVLLRWALQNGVSVIPRSRSVSHIKMNAALTDFELSLDDMRTIDSLEHLVESPLSKPRRPNSDHFNIQALTNQ